LQLSQRGEEHNYDQVQNHSNQQDPGNGDKAPLVAQTRTDAICIGRAFSGYKAQRNAQA
jgi:hypothetical protein